MSARKPPGPPERPSDEVKTEIYDSSKRRRMSEPIQAISMKTPSDEPVRRDEPTKTPAVPRPKLRPASNVAPASQQSLGHLAPPYDPKAARVRTMQDYIIWGSVAVILASGIALIVWFVAR